MSKCGTGKDHCCYLGAAGICDYVVESEVEGFNWACSLRTREGSWELVYQTEEYVSNVLPKLRAAGVEQDCGSWPPKGVKCGDCGEVG